MDVSRNGPFIDGTRELLASISGGTTRTFTYDAAGNVTYDNRTGQGYGYTYNAANRMESFSINGVVQAEYKYNYLGQQAIRTLMQTGQVINSVYGPDGNRMAEFGYDPVAGSSSLLREYVWFEGKPVAVVEGGVVYFVRSDHIGRPVLAMDGTGAKGALTFRKMSAAPLRPYSEAGANPHSPPHPRRAVPALPSAV